jgi:predicted phage terminase large subunit-like protein
VESKFEQHRLNIVLIENKSTGQALISDLKHSRLPIKAVDVPTRDKVARANAITPLCESGKVFVKEGTPWYQEFIDELCAFPAAAYDDWVDTLTQGLDYARNRTMFGVPTYETALSRRSTSQQRGAY